MKTTYFTHIDIEVQSHSIKKTSTQFSLVEGEISNKYELKVALEHKIYPKTYYNIN
jgi:hypothetical protein